MMTVARLRRKPRHFQAFTGLSVAEFDRLLAEVAPAYEAALQQRRQQQPGRQREAGAGHPFALALPERLLLGLVHLRLYVTHSLLAYLFGLDESNVSRELNQRLLPCLLAVLPVPLRDAPLRHRAADAGGPAPEPAGGRERPRRKIGTLDELLAAYPEIKEVLLDATEQPVPQPKDKQQRKLRYSGKQQDHTAKTQILATRRLILHAFGGLPGCLNDMLVLRASGVLPRLPPGTRVRLDKGYQGAEAAAPELAVQSPLRKPRGGRLDALERAHNHLLSVLRMPVEHHFARLKTFRALAEVWRGRFAAHEDTFCVVAGLLNFRATGRFTLA